MATPSPSVVREIENNLLLKQALAEIQNIKTTQELNHLVSLQLRDHQTIARVDSLWATMGQLSFLMKVIVGLLALLPLGGLAAITHVLTHWP